VAQTSGCTTVTIVALLFAAMGSVVDELTVAVLDIGPAVDGEVTVIVMVADPPCAIVPVSEQVTVVVPEQAHPAGAFAETKVVVAGMVSTTCTVEALAWPRFCT
jgi:hypothetical protein